MKDIATGRPSTGDEGRFLEYVKAIFQSQWVTNNGPLVRELEGALCDFLGVKHCMLVNNATVGLQVALRSMDLHGDVIVPRFTFPATFQSIRWVGLNPVFCDINPQTHLLEVDALHRLVTPRTSAVVGVHLWGQPCSISEISRFAEERSLKLVFDAAHSFGSRFRGVSIGNFGNCEVFSFHATKVFSTFEGGAITTNDDHLAAKIRLMRNHGILSECERLEMGTNAKLSEIHAAWGLANLDGLPKVFAHNQRNLSIYRGELASLPGIRVLDWPGNEVLGGQYVVVEVDEDKAGIGRDGLHAYLKEEKIHCKRYFSWRLLDASENEQSLPNTAYAASRTLVLPNGKDVSELDVLNVCHCIQTLLMRTATC